MRGCGVVGASQFRIDAPSTSTPWKKPGTVPGVFMNPNGATQFDGAIHEKSAGDMLLRKPTIELRVGNRDSSSDPRAGNRVVRR